MCNLNYRINITLSLELVLSTTYPSLYFIDLPYKSKSAIMKRLFILLLLHFIPGAITAQENTEIVAVRDTIVEVVYPEPRGAVSDFEDIFSE